MNTTGLYVIGDEDAVFGFGLVGVEGEAAHSPATALHLLQQAVTRTDIDVVLITDEWAAAMRAEIEPLRMALPRPLLVEIPGGRQVQERPSLRTMLRQALGIQLES